MNKQELIDYYSDLVIMQYKNKPKARSHVELLADIFSNDLLPLTIKGAFDLDTAVGEQLDFIGKYFGATRVGRVIGDIVSLDDDDYRILLKILLVTNYSDATLYEMQKVLFDNFGLAIVLYDYKKMRMGYFLSDSLFSNSLAQFVVLNDLLPYPMGVRGTATIFASEIGNLYGFVEYDNIVPTNRAPLNAYDDFNVDYVWLSYQDSIAEGILAEEMITEDGLFRLITEIGNQIIFE